MEKANGSRIVIKSLVDGVVLVITMVVYINAMAQARWLLKGDARYSTGPHTTFDLDIPRPNTAKLLDCMIDLYSSQLLFG